MFYKVQFLVLHYSFFTLTKYWDESTGQVAYADDLVIFEGNKSVASLRSNLESELHLLQTIIDSLKLSVNVTKTKTVLFRRNISKYGVTNRAEIRAYQIKSLTNQPIKQENTNTWQ